MQIMKHWTLESLFASCSLATNDYSDDKDSNIQREKEENLWLPYDYFKQNILLF